MPQSLLALAGGTGATGAAGAGLAGSTASGLGAAGGLGLGGAAATPGLSLAGAAGGGTLGAGATLGSGALGSGIGSIGSGLGSLTGGISTAGGIAPGLMQAGAGGGFMDSIMGGVNKAKDALGSDYGQAAQSLVQGSKPPQIPPAQVNPNAGQNLGAKQQSPEDQMNAILASIFGLRQ